MPYSTCHTAPSNTGVVPSRIIWTFLCLSRRSLGNFSRLDGMFVFTPRDVLTCPSDESPRFVFACIPLPNLRKILARNLLLPPRDFRILSRERERERERKREREANEMQVRRRGGKGRKTNDGERRRRGRGKWTKKSLEVTPMAR